MRLSVGTAKEKGEVTLTGKIVIRCPEMAILATMKPWIRECQELVGPNNERMLGGSLLRKVSVAKRIAELTPWTRRWPATLTESSPEGGV